MYFNLSIPRFLSCFCLSLSLYLSPSLARSLAGCNIQISLVVVQCDKSSETNHLKVNNVKIVPSQTDQTCGFAMHMKDGWGRNMLFLIFKMQTSGFAGSICPRRIQFQSLGWCPGGPHDEAYIYEPLLQQGVRQHSRCNGLLADEQYCGGPCLCPPISCQARCQMRSVFF